MWPYILAGLIGSASVADSVTTHQALARGATVVTGLTTVVAVTVTSQDDMDGDTIASVSATIGDQAGTPAAGSVIPKAWKVTTGGAAGNPTQIAATVAKNLNWIAVGT